MDSTPTIVQCIQQACRDLDFPVPEDSIASYVIGLGIHDSLRRVVPTIDPKHFPTLVDRFRYHYLAKDHELDLFQGMRDLLENLRNQGYRLGVPARKMLMIGDTTHDLQMAQAAGVDAIAVTYGAHPADALRSANSLACLDNVEVLGNWLMQNLYQNSQIPAESSKAS
ncbi:MAG: hypothetical protein RLZZ119_809 [Pseudomonadota bacterium]